MLPATNGFPIVISTPFLHRFRQIFTLEKWEVSGQFETSGSNVRGRIRLMSPRSRLWERKSKQITCTRATKETGKNHE